jgi:hypothetical protein
MIENLVVSPTIKKIAATYTHQALRHPIIVCIECPWHYEGGSWRGLNIGVACKALSSAPGRRFQISVHDNQHIAPNAVAKNAKADQAV